MTTNSRVAGRRRDREAIRHHYDISNEFYQLFLDSRMLYTCAWFRDPNASLEQAQRDKLDLVCRKLRLRPGDRLLDIGCGWGSLALWAAEHYGAEVLGVTLAEEQVKFAQARIREAGLEDSCRVEYRDYRDIKQETSFDKIAAIGIIEHIGRENYSSYFAKVHSLLKPDGLFLNHGITRMRHWKHTPQWDYLIENVFPGGDLTHISHLIETLEDEHFDILDVENLRPHYARTCALWADRLKQNEAEATALVGEKTCRIWRLYLAASAVAFEQGSIHLHQTLVAKAMQNATTTPTSREELYRDWPERPDATKGL
ncbi:MAG: cyclopropane-fatty-acyl-phospholipid synthase family protein [Deltaproteobacteria bacterium]